MTYNKMKAFYISSIALLCCILAFGSCKKVPIGYLETRDAVFEPDTIHAYRIVDPNSERAKTGAPWTSLRIQGVSGTNPINYEFKDVKATEGGDAHAFRQAVAAGDILIFGGIVQIFPKALETVPNGVYILTLRVYNDGHSAILKDILTVVVSDQEPPTVLPQDQEKGAEGDE